jgi:hypothetical protein
MVSIVGNDKSSTLGRVLISPELPTWRGLHVVATDGDNYSLPAAGDSIERGYTGAAVKGGRETYYPRMYVSTLYNVLSGRVLAFEESIKNNDLAAGSKAFKSCAGAEEGLTELH